MKLFLAGSLGINGLPEQVLTELEKYLALGAEIVVGDAPGGDAHFQKYLKEAGYQQVQVFHSAPEVRYNLGQWPTRFVDSGLQSTGKATHGAKDRAMSAECDQGLMVWDGKSAGTLTNVVDLIGRGKPWALFRTDGERSHLVSDFESLRGSNATLVDEAFKRLDAHRRREEKRRQSITSESAPFLL